MPRPISYAVFCLKKKILDTGSRRPDSPPSERPEARIEPRQRGGPTMSKLTRRDVLKLGSAAAAAAGLGFPAVLRAQQKEIPMLGLWSFTGAFSDVGPVLDRGM